MFSFHDSVSTKPQTGNVVIDKDTPLFYEWRENDCRSPTDPFVPGADADILLQYKNKFDLANPLRACPRRAAGASGPCNAADLAVGDFDGDGRDDLFFGSGATWWYSSAGKAEWRFLNRHPSTASDLRFGDLDADGRTDVIALRGNQLLVSWAGASRPSLLSTISAPGFENVVIDDLAVGQFDTDRRADLFVSNGQTWRWSSGGTGPWNVFGGHGFRTTQLRFGDFTQDGITDVFMIVSNRWRIVPGPGAPSQPLGVAQVTNVNELVVADFDGVGGADVAFFRDNPWPALDEWRVSRGGTAASTRLTEAGPRLAALPVGNFDLVAGADVLYWNNDLWLGLVSFGRAEERWSRQSMR